MIVGNHVEPNILVRNNIYNKEWYFNLVNFLQNFDCCGCLTLHVHTEKALIFQKKKKKKERETHPPPFPTLKCLKIRSSYFRVDDSELRADLHWCAPSIETLSIDY